MIRKAVIPAAGLGTRLLPVTKEQPKEMLPIFIKGANGFLRVKPFIQVVFEQLYHVGFKDFCFIIRRGKKTVENYFTLDDSIIQQLSRKNQFELARDLINFYEKVRNSNIFFINQPDPAGFGNAVFLAKNFTGSESFLVHAGDDLILSEDNKCLMRLVRVFEEKVADAVFYVQKVRDPRKYGVIDGKKIDSNLYQVMKIEEKPSSPFSKLAVIAIYAFSPKVYNAIQKTQLDVHKEIQLTDAIQHLICEKCGVYALELEKGEKRIDIGTPDSYWKVLQTTKKWRTMV